MPFLLLHAVFFVLLCCLVPVILVFRETLLAVIFWSLGRVGYGIQFEGDKCWVEFKLYIASVVGNKEFVDRLLDPKVRNMKGIRRAMEGWYAGDILNLKTVYYKKFSDHDKRNHISFEYFQGANSMFFHQFLADERFSFTKWNLINLNINWELAVDVARVTAIAGRMPRSGAPLTPSALFATRRAAGRLNMNSTLFFTITSEQAALPKNSALTKVAVDVSAAPWIDYFAGTGANAGTMNTFAIDAYQNMIGIGAHNDSRHYFKVLGIPHPTAGSSYYYSWVNMSEADIQCLLSDQYHAVTTRAKDTNKTDALHKIAQMLQSWGYAIWVNNKVQALDPAVPDLDITFADVLWPGGMMVHGGTPDVPILMNDRTAAAIRTDLRTIAASMTIQKNANKAPGATVRAMLAEIPEEKFLFFAKSGNGKVITR